MLLVTDVLFDALSFLERLEIDKCQLLSRRIRRDIDVLARKLPRQFILGVWLVLSCINERFS